ncbi:MAG: glycosyl hydrolase family 38, partial [Bacteroidales bacterium]|nr:glycosyl hydrolase family 38 [Bacteroidales bacterium]
PYSKGTMEQRAMKESYAWEAFRRSRRVGEEAMGLLQGYVKREEVPVIAVFNTMNQDRSGLLNIYIDHQIIPMGANFKLIDKNGNEHQAQALEHRSDGTYWSIWVSNVPGFGMKKLRVIMTSSASTQNSLLKKYQSSINESDTKLTLNNEYYTIEIYKSNAVINELYDKSLNLQIVDKDAKWKLGEFIYEKLGNREQLEALTLNDYSRISLDTVWFENIQVGSVWTSIRFKGESEACIGPAGFELDIRVFHEQKRIDFVYMLRKKRIIKPEAVYIAFPFMLPDGKIFFDVPGGTVQAGIDQIPGSATDWNTVQNFASIRNKNAQIILSSAEAPLMQLGGINTGRFKAGSTPENTYIFGWPMNNYWTTNFNADQGGEFSFSYSLTSGKDTGNKEATLFGWERRIPLLGRTLPPGSPSPSNSWPDEGSLLHGIPDNVLLISAQIANGGNEILLHIRELDNKNTPLMIKSPVSNSLEIQETDVLGNPLENGDPKVINALETKFIKLSWE